MPEKMGMFLATLTKKEGTSVLRIVQPGELAPRNDALRAALNKITRGVDGQEGLAIFEGHEAEALYRVLASMQFTQKSQLDGWIDRLRADNPYDRRVPISPKFGFWAWVRYIFLSKPAPPEQVRAETFDSWRKRADRYVDEQIASVDEPTWLERPLQSLIVARHQIERETGKTQWAMPVLRWALVQLLMVSADTNSASAHTTG